MKSLCTFTDTIPHTFHTKLPWSAFSVDIVTVRSTLIICWGFIPAKSEILQMHEKRQQRGKGHNTNKVFGYFWMWFWFHKDQLQNNEFFKHLCEELEIFVKNPITCAQSCEEMEHPYRTFYLITINRILFCCYPKWLFGILQIKFCFDCVMVDG